MKRQGHPEETQKPGGPQLDFFLGAQRGRKNAGYSAVKRGSNEIPKRKTGRNGEVTKNDSTCGGAGRHS